MVTDKGESSRENEDYSHAKAGASFGNAASNSIDS